MAKSMRKYMGNGDVRNAIRRMGKQIAADLTDKEIWLSAEFGNYADRLASFILRKHKLYSLKIQYITNDSAPVAYTDGRNIVLNTGNPLARMPKLLEGRFKVNMGILFHECAHKLFLDFNVHNKALEQMEEDGTLFGKFDVPAGSDLESNLQELKDALSNGYKKAMTSVYAEVTNIINDGHDEASMKKCFPGFVTQCINTAGEVQMELSTPLSEIVEDGAPLRIMYSLMLQYAKFGYCNVGEESDLTDPYMEILRRMEPVIDDALAEDNYAKRWNHVNVLVLLLWPFIRSILQQKKQQSSGNNSSNGNAGGSGGGAGGAQSGSNGDADGDSGGSGSFGSDEMLSDEEIEQMLQSLAEQASADNGAAPAPTGTGASVSVRAVMSGSSGGDAPTNAGINAILDQIGEEKAAEAVQTEITKAQLDAIRGTNRPLVHKNVSVKVNRQHNADKAAYDEMYADVRSIVKNMISEITALLREHNEEAIQHHKRFGPIIEATEAYRPDNAFFAKKKLPEDRPNMAMCVLLDESGSMGGPKIQMAKKTMIMLEQFAAGIGVPLMIAGHCVQRGVTLNVYTDYVSARPEQDRYALSAITSHGCNRDGLPLRLCAEMLAQRPEDIRLMVVISDGAPNDDGYSGREAFDDIKKTVAEFRRKGLLIYGAAIDEDREVIQELYGSGFLSITDLKSLPKTMVRLLRQNVV